MADDHKSFSGVGGAFRRIHRRLGWKFWAIISGGAALPEELETFWNRVGYAVIQGYGMTETTSLISLNHPFHSAKGSLGKVFPGMEVRIDENGEILVRGENVAKTYQLCGGHAEAGGRRMAGFVPAIWRRRATRAGYISKAGVKERDRDAGGDEYLSRGSREGFARRSRACAIAW